MELNDGELIDTVREFDVIYDKGNKLHRDRTAHDNAWGSIALILNNTVDVCKTRWVVLRNRYTIERNKRRNTPSGSGARKYTWPLMEAMSFLEGHIKNRRSKGNIELQPRLQQSSCTNGMCSPSWGTYDEGDSSQAGSSEDVLDAEDTLEDADVSHDDTFITTSNYDNVNTPATKHINDMSNTTIEFQKLNNPSVKRKTRNNIVSTITSTFANINNKLSTDKPDEAEFGISVAKDLSKIKCLKIRMQAKLDIQKVITNTFLQDSE